MDMENPLDNPGDGSCHLAPRMVTQEVRLLSLLRSAALWKRNWREREKQTLRMLVDSLSTSQAETKSHGTKAILVKQNESCQG